MNNEKIPYTAAPGAVRAEITKTLQHTPAILSNMMASLASSQGKNIRGTLTVLSACDADRQTDETAVKIAAAIEILHLASLVHDDIIDDADTRRGLPSLHSQFGRKHAVMAGDFLFCLCFSLISDAYSMRKSEDYIDRIGDFAKVMGALCMGEIRQSEHNFDIDLDLKNYLRIIGGKTAALFALSMYAGARAADMPHENAKIYGRIGGYFGIIFQLIDDCLDYDGKSETLEKPAGKDLREGIITLPFIYAAKKDPSLKALLKNGVPTDEIARFAISRVAELGGVSHTRDLAAKYYAKTRKFIALLDDDFKKEELLGILDRLCDRQK